MKRSRRIREISGVRYLYTAKMNEDGEFVYLIDCLDQSEPDFRYPGDLIEHEIYPDMQRALDGQKVLPDRIKDTEWGKYLSPTCHIRWGTGAGSGGNRVRGRPSV